MENMGDSVTNLHALQWKRRDPNPRLDRTHPAHPASPATPVSFRVGRLKNESKVYMKNSDTHNQRIAKMTFASVYPMYIEKVEKKGRTQEELNQVIEWLTNFDDKKLQELIQENATFETFFQHAALNPNAQLITGVICGVRVEEIENPLTQQVRYLDKLVDELAKGKKMKKILRGS
jgi:hypothetical protein